MIGGFHPCSFLDFPGRLSAVVFLRGCNLRCPYCHNRDLLDGDGPPAMDEPALRAFLSARRGRLDGVVFSGGEPTLQPELRPLIEAARALGYRVKLDTNGTRPEVLQELLGDGLLDYVALDLKDEPAAYAEWLGMREGPEVLLHRLDVVKSSGIDHELRTTVVFARHDEERLGRMAWWARGCRRWILQPCRPDVRHAAIALNPSREAALEDLASRLHARHGVPCRCRSARRSLRGASPVMSAQRGDATCP
ncbi:MAG TPA: anaerobic ribonucleoside-triphosphate reductase activating protein [Vicinamibacteria bacterium]|nr:anaerobic ribonucleoside-triphosphate reductase activating protein [Vicinamibacteria bacterium]